MKPSAQHPTKGMRASSRLALQWAIAVGTVAAFVGLTWVVWQRLGPQVATDDDYLISPDEVHIEPPPPPWIRSDVRAAALRNAGFDERVSLLEEDLTERIARAFSLQPWIARVERVEKRYPAQVLVTVEYRRPVCMVEVPGGLYAVDAEGVVLPSQDFSPLEARRYPRLAGIDSVPIGPVGTAWGDPRVAGGARIAAALLEHWHKLGLARIAPLASGAATIDGSQIAFALISTSGMRIIWGASPGAESRLGEPTAEEKLARLLDYVARHGPLDGPHAPAELDLRHRNRAATAPQDAAGSLR